MHQGITHVPWCMPGSLTSGFLWWWRRGKTLPRYWRMRNPLLYVSGKRPMDVKLPCRQVFVVWYDMSRRPWRYGSRSKVFIHGTPFLSAEYLYQEWKVPAVERNLRRWLDFIVPFFCKVTSRWHWRYGSISNAHTFSWWWILIPCMEKILQ